MVPTVRCEVVMLLDCQAVDSSVKSRARLLGQAWTAVAATHAG